MVPKSISENMMYNTVKLETLNGSAGTGFFFDVSVRGKTVPVLMTNKHVVNNNPHEAMTFLLHLCDGNGGDSGENFKVVFNTDWIFHPTHDICFTYVAPLLTEVQRRTGKTVFYRSIDESIIYTEKKLEDLNALESVVMIGYPTGLWDSLHNYPLFRKGFTASHPGYDFNEKGIGLIDIACFPGSSGSPIFILDENGYSDKEGNSYIGAKRLIFLGVQFAGPTMDVNGDIILIDIPTQQKAISHARTMVNLGYYIKAHELLKFKPMVEQVLLKNGEIDNE
ncbi:hypothetical protein CXIVA_18400 [Clostridium sp. SY8519]|uniref:trypsin-like peptidase domain-containing protein n=1 Tax=Clostridium sp. (strain SY8519) TaxID=1042156 RepID=UPI0002171EC9|nr:trypsin-like peptidase domain-containing protein [Clostridium sp. SY8519]BAK47807.1 hypothetical protein CXIVA_18400 [Clostridium sp. SY8519]